MKKNNELDIIAKVLSIGIVDIPENSQIEVRALLPDNEPEKSVDILLNILSTLPENGIDEILDRFLKETYIKEINIEIDDLKNILITCNRNKNIQMAYKYISRIKYLIYFISQRKNKHFMNLYNHRKESIDNIIFFKSEKSSFVTFLKDDNDFIKGNNLYISVSDFSEYLKILNNDEVSNKILEDFYNENERYINTINKSKSGSQISINFDNNKNIVFYDCRYKYDDFINKCINDLIDKKSRKVYEKVKK